MMRKQGLRHFCLGSWRHLPPVAGTVVRAGVVQAGEGSKVQLEAVESLIDGAGRLETWLIGKPLLEVHSRMMVYVQLTCRRNRNSGGIGSRWALQELGWAPCYSRACGAIPYSCSSTAGDVGFHISPVLIKVGATQGCEP